MFSKQVASRDGNFCGPFVLLSFAELQPIYTSFFSFLEINCHGKFFFLVLFSLIQSNELLFLFAGMSHLCIVHSPDGVSWADYTISKLLSQFPDLKIAIVSDEKAFSNCTRSTRPVPDSDALILIASPDLLEYLNTHSDVVFNEDTRARDPRFVKHCIFLLLGLEKEDMDGKADHFPAYEKWTHLTLTEDEVDLKASFQRIIEVMQEIVNSRTAKARNPPPRTKPKPQVRPKPKPNRSSLIQKQEHVEMSSGDELEAIVKIRAFNEKKDKFERMQKGPAPVKEQKLPANDESQSGVLLSSPTARDDQHNNTDDENKTRSNTPATPKDGQDDDVTRSEKEGGDSDIYTRQLEFVSGTALLKTEIPMGEEDSSSTYANTVHIGGVTLKPFAQVFMRREIETDDSSSVYANASAVVPGGKKTSDLNDNLVAAGDGAGVADSPAEDWDDVDGLEALVPAPEDPPLGPHRPRSTRQDMASAIKRFRNKSAALRFTLSPAVVNGDVSKICVQKKKREGRDRQTDRQWSDTMPNVHSKKMNDESIGEVRLHSVGGSRCTWVGLV